MSECFIGIDIGGTKTAVSLGTADGEIVAAKRMPSDGHGSVEAYFEALFALSDEVLGEAGPRRDDLAGVGISAPGPLSVRDGLLIAPPNNAGWENVPVVARCQDHFELPVWMNNDANAGVLAEYYFGACRGEPNLLYLTCSTGMGGGIISGGHLVQGASDMGGEVGHQTLDPNGVRCRCGQRGCFEAYCGGAPVAGRVQMAIRDDGIETAITSAAGGNVENIDFRAILEAVRMRDPYALEIWEDYTGHLAHGLGNLIMVLNPGVVLLGTIAVHAGNLLLDPLREKLVPYTWSWSREVCEVRPATLGDRMGALCGLAVARHAGM